MLAKIAPQKMQRNCGGAKGRVHLHLDGCHLAPNCHLCHVMPTKPPKQKVHHPHMSIYILCVPTHDFSRGSHAQCRFISRFADSAGSIHRLVHYELRRNAADSHCDDRGSCLIESDSDEDS
jgi:hypothetical protein